MADKNLLESFTLGTLDLSASGATQSSRIKSIDLVSIQINATGTPTGEFFVEGSNDDGANWVPLVLSPTASVAGAATQILINLRMVAFMAIRVSYTRSSGTGAATVIIAGLSCTGRRKV